MRNSDSHIFLEDGAKLKILSEITKSLKNYAADFKRRKNRNKRRKIDSYDDSSAYGIFSSASNNEYKKRKIDSDDNSSGYGIISAASNAYKVISE